MTGEEPRALRLDVWLWRARLFKTRSLAADHVSARGVRMTRHGATRRVTKPAANVMTGDVLIFGKGDHITSLRVRDLGVRRGPAAEARELYDPLGDNDA